MENEPVNVPDPTRELGFEPADVQGLRDLLNLYELFQCAADRLDPAPPETGGPSPRGHDLAAKAMGLPLELALELARWRRGEVGAPKIWAAFAAAGPEASRLVRAGVGPEEDPEDPRGAERAWLRRLQAACLTDLPCLLDTELPRILTRRLVRLEPGIGGGRHDIDPKAACRELVEPVMSQVRARLRRRAVHRGRDPDSEGVREEIQTEVDRLRKKPWPDFAAAWYELPSMLGEALAEELGASALDKLLRTSDSIGVSNGIYEARARGDDDEAVMALAQKALPAGKTPECGEVSGPPLVPVDLPVPGPEQLRRTTETCTLRDTIRRSDSCESCVPPQGADPIRAARPTIEGANVRVRQPQRCRHLSQQGALVQGVQVEGHGPRAGP